MNMNNGDNGHLQQRCDDHLKKQGIYLMQFDGNFILVGKQFKRLAYG